MAISVDSDRPLPFYTMLGWALVMTVVGQGTGGLAILAHGPPAGAESQVVPTWLFPVVWTILFPCFAVATLRIHRERAHPARVPTLALGACALGVILAWLPISCAAENAWVSVYLDILGFISIWATALMYGRISRAAMKWMAPLMTWMPITTVISVLSAVGG